MINTILSQLASETSGELTSKAGISQNMLGEMFKLTGNLATQEVGKQATSQGVSSLMNLFSNKPNNNFANNLQKSLTDSLVNNYASKFGLSKQQASLAAGIVVPALISLVTKENSKTPANDSSPIEKAFGLGNSKNATKVIGGLVGKFLKK